MTTKEFETLTAQQEIAYREYLEQEYQKLPFIEWYRHWCYENNYFCDLHSFQIRH